MKRPMVKTMTIDHVDCEKHAWRVCHEQSALRTVVSPRLSARRKEPDYATRAWWTHLSCDKQLLERHMLQHCGDLLSKNEVAGKLHGH